MTARHYAAFGPLVALVVACAFFASQSSRFLSPENFSLIVQQVMVVGVLAIRQTLVILTAGIDLSCGMVMAFGSMVMSLLATRAGVSPALAVTIGLGATTLAGTINGLLVTRLSLPPFIVTLGTMNIAFALTQIVSRSQSVTDLPPLLTALGDTVRIGGTPIAYGALAMLALYAVAWWLLRETAGGRHLYAVGNHREAARLSGIDTSRVLLVAYALAGLCAGLAALLSIARTGVGDPQAGQTENLDTVTAVVLGGTSLFGGRGGIGNTIIGLLVLGVLNNGLDLINIDSFLKILIRGLILLAALVINVYAQKLRESTA